MLNGTLSLYTATTCCLSQLCKLLSACCRCSGSLRNVDFIDVASQDEGHMTMQQWREYFMSTDRPRVLNVLSLELAGTRCLCSLIWHFVPANKEPPFFYFIGISSVCPFMFQVSIWMGCCLQAVIKYGIHCIKCPSLGWKPLFLQNCHSMTPQPEYRICLQSDISVGGWYCVFTIIPFFLTVNRMTVNLYSSNSIYCYIAIF